MQFVSLNPTVVIFSQSELVRAGANVHGDCFTLMKMDSTVLRRGETGEISPL